MDLVAKSQESASRMKVVGVFEKLRTAGYGTDEALLLTVADAIQREAHCTNCCQQ